MNKKAEKSINEYNILTFKRGPYSSNTLDSTDKGTYVSFDRISSNESLLKINFAYMGVGKKFTSDIHLDLDNVIELKKYLDSFIEYEARRK